MLLDEHVTFKACIHPGAAFNINTEPVKCCLDGFPVISAQQFNKQAAWAGEINDGLVNFKLCVKWQAIEHITCTVLIIQKSQHFVACTNSLCFNEGKDSSQPLLNRTEIPD